MKWNLKINGQKVTWRLSDVVAVVPPPNFPRPRPELENSNGKYSGNGKGHPDREQLARKTFERAGWQFIDAKTRRPKKKGGQAPDSKDIRQVFTNKRGDILIETDVATVQLNAAAITKKYTAKRVLEEDGLSIIHQFNFAPDMYAVQLPSGRSLPETIEALQDKTDTYVFAEPNMLERMSGRQAPNDPLFGQQWQHKNDYGLHSLAAWEITKGAGVRIAIIDNGMEIDHDDLRDGIVGGGYFEHRPPGAAVATFVRFQPGMTDFPDSGHGTACMGMAGARLNNGNDGCGIAPESQLLAIACALDQTSTQATLAQSIAYAINPQHVNPGDLTRGADVISCSLDTTYHVQSVLARAIDSAATGRNGLGVPVFWAVNNVTEQLSNDLLCSLPGVIAVGRSRENGNVYRCARGPKLEFLAPGLNLIGPVWDFNDEWSGTSFATPLAAGVAALVLQRHPTWTATRVLQRLRDTCDMPPHPPAENDRYGHGRINAYRAVHDPV